MVTKDLLYKYNLLHFLVFLKSPWNSPGQNTGVGSLSLLQGIFPIQGSILYQLSHKGSPRILEWVASPFSRASSWPRNQTGVSCIAGGLLPAEVSGKPFKEFTQRVFTYIIVFVPPDDHVKQIIWSLYLDSETVTMIKWFALNHIASIRAGTEIDFFWCEIVFPFILLMGFARKEYWSGLPFPSPVDNFLSELFTMTRLSWVALHGTAHSFIELDKAVVHMMRLVSFLWLWFSVCLPSDGEG